MTFRRRITYPTGLSHDIQAHHIEGFEQLALQVGGAEAYLGRDDALALAAYIQESFA